MNLLQYEGPEVLRSAVVKMYGAAQKLYLEDGIKTDDFSLKILDPSDSRTKFLYGAFEHGVNIVIFRPYHTEFKDFKGYMEGVSFSSSFKRSVRARGIYRCSLSFAERLHTAGWEAFEGYNEILQNPEFDTCTHEISANYAEDNMNTIVPDAVHETAHKIFADNLGSLNLPIGLQCMAYSSKLNEKFVKHYKGEIDCDLLDTISEEKRMLLGGFEDVYGRLSKLRGVNENIARAQVLRLTGVKDEYGYYDLCDYLIDDVDVTASSIDDFAEYSYAELIEMGLDGLLGFCR